MMFRMMSLIIGWCENICGIDKLIFLCDKRNQCRSEFTESALRDAWVRLRCDTQQSGTFWLAEIVQFDHDFSNVLSDLLNVISSERHFVL